MSICPGDVVFVPVSVSATLHPRWEIDDLNPTVFFVNRNKLFLVIAVDTCLACIVNESSVGWVDAGALGNIYDADAMIHRCATEHARKV